jgi:hypothetical protein
MRNVDEGAEDVRAEALGALAEHLDGAQLSEALDAARQIGNERAPPARWARLPSTGLPNIGAETRGSVSGSATGRSPARGDSATDGGVAGRDGCGSDR